VSRLSSRWPAIDGEILLRALAIGAVVLNHSQTGLLPDGWGYGGGMTFLLMLTGFNVAKFSIRNGSADGLRSSLVRFAVNLFLPSLAMVLISSVLFSQFRTREFLFISNWFTWVRPRVFHLWYPEVVIQMMLGLWLAFRIPGVARTIIDHPLWTSLGLFLAAVWVRSEFAHVWNADAVKGRLPHLWLWVFFLGWVVFFATRTSLIARRTGLVVAISCAILGGFVGYGLTRTDFWWLTAGTAILVLVPRIPLPLAAARVTNILSQATFAIFLLHQFFLETHHQLGLPRHPYLKCFLALAASAGAWLAWTSSVRAYRSLGGPSLSKRHRADWIGQTAGAAG